MVPVFRFAPSPNGYLHLGHAASALLNFDLAREIRGRLLLRIEDIDVTRCPPAGMRCADQSGSVT
jgi:glutamyl-Q tRNA(Asp) synthetase